MSTIGRPSGRHSPAVYWRRRVVLIVTVILIIWGVSRLVGGSDDSGGGGDGQAAPATSQSSTAPTTDAEPTDPAASDDPSPKPKKRKEAQRVVNVSLPASGAPCDPGSVQVAPSVAAGTYAGGGVPLQIGFSTTATTACTVKVTTKSLVVAVNDGDDDLWESGQCNPLDDRTVEIQPTWTTFVEIDWSGRENGKKCGKLGDFVPAGSYEVKVAMLGGEPASHDFTLVKRPEPKPKPKPKPTSKSDKQESDKKPS